MLCSKLKLYNFGPILHMCICNSLSAYLRKSDNSRQKPPPLVLQLNLLVSEISSGFHHPEDFWVQLFQECQQYQDQETLQLKKMKITLP